MLLLNLDPKNELVNGERYLEKNMRNNGLFHFIAVALPKGAKQALTQMSCVHGYYSFPVMGNNIPIFQFWFSSQ